MGGPVASEVGLQSFLRLVIILVPLVLCRQFPLLQILLQKVLVVLAARLLMGGAGLPLDLLVEVVEGTPPLLVILRLCFGHFVGVHDQIVSRVHIHVHACLAPFQRAAMVVLLHLDPVHVVAHGAQLVALIASCPLSEDAVGRLDGLLGMIVLLEDLKVTDLTLVMEGGGVIL